MFPAVIIAVVDPPPFVFGPMEALFTGVAVAIIFGIIGPRYLKARRQKKD